MSGGCNLRCERTCSVQKFIPPGAPQPWVALAVAARGILKGSLPPGEWEGSCSNELNACRKLSYYLLFRTSATYSHHDPQRRMSQAQIYSSSYWGLLGGTNERMVRVDRHRRNAIYENCSADDGKFARASMPIPCSK